MKKIISFMLTMIMVLSMSVVAFATEPETPQRPTSGTNTTVRGTITINNVTIEDNKPVATYKIYKLLELDSYDFTTGSYTYKYNNEWKAFFTNDAGKDYVTVNDKGLLVWQGSEDAERVAEFAKIALAYAKGNNIPPVKTTATPEDEAAAYRVVGESSIVFEDLDLGYYLVDSTVGALCGLSTTNPDGIINSKNGAPEISKQVQEDLTLQWDKTNTADIGQIVNFRTTIHVHDGAQKYVLHDIMDPGLTFPAGANETAEENVKVKLVSGSGSGNVDGVLVQRIETDAEGNEYVNYEVVTFCEDECTFEVHFTERFCESLNTNDRLIIFYSAMLNRNAEIGHGTADNQPNENKTYLSYGENHKTTEATTVTKTYGIDLTKTDGQNKLLNGATFRIYDAETGNTEVTVVPLKNDLNKPITTDEGYAMYRKARPGETGAEIVVTNGVVRIVGLDNGVYWLEEIKNPEGYNKITSRQKFTISDNNLDAIITNSVVSTNSGVQVVNHTGSMLPETGASGTAWFIGIGMLVVLGTGVVLVTKKRLSMIQD